MIHRTIASLCLATCLLVTAWAVLADENPEGITFDSTTGEKDRRQIRTLLDSERSASDLGKVTVDYPLDGSIFPPDMIAPLFLWHDDSPEADLWLVDVSIGDFSHRYVLVSDTALPRPEIDRNAIAATNEIYKPTDYQASARGWRPSPELWSSIVRDAAEQPARVTFLGYDADDPGTVLSRGGTTLRVSRDPVGAPIFYRDVPLIPSETVDGTITPLPKNALPLINWRLRDVSRPASRVLLTNMPTCANCHSFSADGKTLGMDIDGSMGDKGAYALDSIEKQMVIKNEEIITWNSFEDKPPGSKTLGFLSRVRPDGQYVVSTVNEQIYVENFFDFRFGQVFFPTRGILAYFSRATGEFKALPGADDPEFVHCDPVWSPDGKTLVFARARAREAYDTEVPRARYAGDPNETRMQYDLYRMPFNEGLGGRPEPIVGASGNGMSNTFPKVSPDGKWIVFVKCENGQLMRPDSELWIVPIEGGQARRMNCNTRLMNSWHSFSPNGRWLVFSSKSNTPYTQMFLTHIDEKGNDSPAILIENSTAANRAVNIPEFVNIAYEDLVKISVPAVEVYRHYLRGNKLAANGRDAEAIAEFELALEEVDDDSRIHQNMSKTLLRMGQVERALKHARESLRINPYNVEMHTNVGYILLQKGQMEESFKHLDLAVRIYPYFAVSWHNRGQFRLKTGDFARAVEDYTEAIRLQRGYAGAHTGRGIALRSQGDMTGAMADFDRAIKLKPWDPTPWYFRALTRQEAGDLEGARDDIGRGLEVVPPDSPRLREMEALLRQLQGGHP